MTLSSNLLLVPCCAIGLALPQDVSESRVLAFLWRGWRSPAYRGSLRQRLGVSLQARTDRPLWLHAASVGEVRALAALVRVLHAQGWPLLVQRSPSNRLVRVKSHRGGYGQKGSQ